MPKNGTSAPPARTVTQQLRLCKSTPRYNFSMGALLSKVRFSLLTTKSYPNRAAPFMTSERSSAVQPPVSHVKCRASPWACPALRLSSEGRAGEPQRGEITKPRPKVRRSHWRTEGLGQQNTHHPPSPERAIHACAHRRTWSAPVLARPFRAGRWERFAAPVPGRWPGLRYLAPLGLNELPLGLNPRPLALEIFAGFSGTSKHPHGSSARDLSGGQPTHD